MKLSFPVATVTVTVVVIDQVVHRDGDLTSAIFMDLHLNVNLIHHTTSITVTLSLPDIYRVIMYYRESTP